MSIWHQKLTLETVNQVAQKNMFKYLEFEITEIGDDFLQAKMPVNDKTKTPFGLLHGGASCVLAETLASMASFCCVDPEKTNVVGLEINANHVKSAVDGFVIGTCRPIHLGKSTKIWDIRIENEKKELVCISRMTVATFPKKG